MNAPESTTIQPPASAWKHASAGGGLLTDEKVARFRHELGLPSGPIVMSGHQADWWHAGILAKYYATVAYARKAPATPIWLVVDQDAGTPESFKYPGERWIARTFPLSSERDEFRPLCRRQTIHPRLQALRAVSPSAQRTVESVCADLERFSNRSDLAQQIMSVLQERLSETIVPMQLVFASRISHTSLYAELCDLMRADASNCVRCYNEAVESAPAAKMRKLREGADPELPLWSISDDGVRTAAKLSGLAGNTLPRALMMTALVRMAGCELFIHGLGGGLYDVITERWIAKWLGIRLAPMTVVSATRYARPVDAPRIVSQSEAIDASRLAHLARHHPSALGDSESQAWRDDIVKRITRATGAEKHALYIVLQTWLKAYRERHSAEISDLNARAEELTAAARAGQGACDRTWPFMFMSKEQRDSLRNEIESAFSSGSGS